MWIVAAIGFGVLAIGWLASRDRPPRSENARKRAEYEVTSLRCDLANAVGEARRWFEMDLPKPAWDSIADAFAILEALKPRIERPAWTALQADLLAAIPRALDAQPRARQRRRRPRVARA